MLVRPRSTSKSGAKRGCLGTRESAEEISRWSSAEGEQTFSMLTLTWGCDACCALAYPRSPTQARKKNLSKHAGILAGLGEFHAVRRKSCNGADRRSSGSQKSKLKRDAIVLAEQIKASRLRLAFFLQPMPLTYNPSSSWKVLTVTFVCGSARLGFCLVAAWPGL